MREELVTFQVAKLAKEKGFDEPCIDTYKDVVLYRHKSKRHNSSFNQQWEEEPIKNSAMSNAKIPRYSAPTQSLLQRWLREVHDIRVLIDFETIDDSETAYTFKIVKYLPEGKNRKKDTWDFYETTYSFNQGGGWYKTYEEALEVGLQEALKLIT